MNSKHTPKTCIYCDKVCNTEVELIKHHKECIEIGLANNKCNKCDNKFTRNGLQRHKPNCHGPKEFDCTECGQVFQTANDVTEHKEIDHEMERVKSRVVCRHWRKGNCLKGAAACNFSHVSHQTGSSATTQNTSRVPACKNGPSCEWLQKGKCSYFHPRVGVQKPWTQLRRQEADRPSAAQPARTSGARGGRQGSWQEAARAQGGQQEGVRTQGGPEEPARTQSGRQGAARAHGGRQEVGRPRIMQPDRDQCKFDGRCERIPNCPWIHSLEDFPILQGRSNSGLRKNTQMRRH